MSAPAPEANGYNVQLYFEGAPLGEALPIGAPAVVTVKRLEQRVDRTDETPITLLSASCDEVCTVTPVASDTGAVMLQATAAHAGGATLHVQVRSVLDGSEWDDAYPLTFR